MACLTLQLGAPEVLDDVLPIRRVIKSSQIRLEFAAENFQRGALADAVGAYKTQHVSGPWHGKSMKLKAVGSISMGDLTLEVGGEIDDRDGAKWAALRADAAADT